MILIQSDNIKSITDVLQKYDFITDLQEAIADYIAENTHLAKVGQKIDNVFYISGFADFHHKNLANYLSKHILNEHNISLKTGTFSNQPYSHSWLVINGNLILDITINQFLQKQNLTHLDPKKYLYYFLSDNHFNNLYNLYNEN